MEGLFSKKGCAFWNLTRKESVFEIQVKETRQ